MVDIEKAAQQLLSVLEKTVSQSGLKIILNYLFFIFLKMNFQIPKIRRLRWTFSSKRPFTIL